MTLISTALIINVININNINNSRNLHHTQIDSARKGIIMESC